MLGSDEIIAAVEATGSIRRAGPYLGVDERTIRRAVQRLGIADEVADARKRYRPGAVPESDAPSILDPARVKAAQNAEELRVLRRDVRDAERALANREATVERFLQAVRRPVRVPDYRVADVDRDKPVRALVLPIFDLQYGQFVQPDDVPFGKGRFSVEVFDERLAHYVERVTGIVADRSGCEWLREVHVVLGGDLVEGADIFAGQAWQLEVDPARQVWDLSEKLAEALRTIIRFCKEHAGVETIGVYCVPGNHGKVGGKRAGATPATCSWDWLLARILEERLAGEPIALWATEAAGSVMFEAAGHTFMAVHGDEIRGANGIPFYGLARFDQRAMRLTGEVYDYLLLGHHHQPATITNGGGGEHVVSGDWVGGNNLGKHLVAVSRPQQRALVVDPNDGVVADERIYFEGRLSRVKAPVLRAA